MSPVEFTNDYQRDRIADLERQLADERSRIDCATRGGWLSDDLECAGEDGPACWMHLLAEAQGNVAALIEVLDEIRWPLIAEPACAGHRVRTKTDSERIRMADDALEGHLPRLKLSKEVLASAKEMREAKKKLTDGMGKALEVELGLRAELTEAQVSIATLQEDVGRAEAELVRADLERQAAQGKLSKVRTWRQATRVNQPANWPVLDRILKEGE